ncbi:chemotaxis protein CheW [Nannocystis punicea]|uniref:Chemotaxis protein CheW n=1 Tax=Nannocystis punicea TaxID=2995304 RepID=A0ABY7HH63_9BACT|nr:chemotaxis protein CheW [Nannocystis poenicansa]WAS98618.1 chemotaxis protein CheW [Nannocystis poenicansa]
MTDLRDARDGRGNAGEEDLKVAGFYVGPGLYGIEIMRIKEVIQARPYPIRPVPYAPAIVEGVIQLRGVVIPVVDLRRRFGAPIDPAIDHLNKLIIVSVAGRIAGLKVDRVLGELRVPAGGLRPAPSMLRPELDRSADGNIFSGVSRAHRHRDTSESRRQPLIGPDRRAQAPTAGHGHFAAADDRHAGEDMVFVINLDALLRTGGR